MPIITVSIDIEADPNVCFDLARSVEAHLASTEATGERAVAGVTSGLLGHGDEVTWRARHLGVVQHLTSRITAFDRPRHYFRDEMTRGIFARLVHDHYFTPTSSGTHMRDVLEYTSPFGVLGRLVDTVYLESYLTHFLADRARALKHLAEIGQAKEILNAGSTDTNRQRHENTH
jgi:ligand-binding SRPBCC domain-containing protein